VGCLSGAVGWMVGLFVGSYLLCVFRHGGFCDFFVWHGYVLAIVLSCCLAVFFNLHAVAENANFHVIQGTSGQGK